MPQDPSSGLTGPCKIHGACLGLMYCYGSRGDQPNDHSASLFQILMQFPSFVSPAPYRADDHHGCPGAGSKGIRSITECKLSRLWQVMWVNKVMQYLKTKSSWSYWYDNLQYTMLC